VSHICDFTKPGQSSMSVHLQGASKHKVRRSNLGPNHSPTHENDSKDEVKGRAGTIEPNPSYRHLPHSRCSTVCVSVSNNNSTSYASLSPSSSSSSLVLFDTEAEVAIENKKDETARIDTDSDFDVVTGTGIWCRHCWDPSLSNVCEQ
jgi:hypothetical protein